ncbi:TfoX/Sxy family protein [Isoptericola aurantiacus]|uniref:TfoX/Sxy family protein n=1 Tax=Isoptericola aurantiacus TaxID=3377839 RepID=UPI00383B7163
MAYDDELADRVRAVLSRYPGLTERRMFGGIAFMLGGHMAAGVVRDQVMVRVGVDGHETALADGATAMTMGDRTMRGTVAVGPDLWGDQEVLDAWLTRGAEHAGSLEPKGG